MTKIDVVSGFLGAGKTTLIKKLLADALNGSKTVLIENEFGEIGIDGGFLQESGIEIKEMNSGCICCSLVGDFGTSLKEVISTYAPERILIEPSGVGKLSDVLKAIENTAGALDVEINSAVAVVDASKAKMYIKNFGEFFLNQIENAGTIILSRTGNMTQEKIEEAVALIREHNAKATIITTPWDDLEGAQILETIENAKSLEEELLKEIMSQPEEEHHHHHHHHHHDDEGEAEEYGIQTFVYSARPPLDINKFDEMVARRWPKEIIRAKGLCYFSHDIDRCFLFEQAGTQKTVRDAGQWYATMPRDELEEMLRRDGKLRRDWDPVYGDRINKIVFIGQHLDREALESIMDFCLDDRARLLQDSK